MKKVFLAVSASIILAVSLLPLNAYAIPINYFGDAWVAHNTEDGKEKKDYYFGINKNTKNIRAKSVKLKGFVLRKPTEDLDFSELANKDALWFEIADFKEINKFIYTFKNNIGKEFKGRAQYTTFNKSTDSGPAPVPEPATILLIGGGLAGLAGLNRKKLFNK